MGHRVVGIGDPDDAGLERDGVAAQAVRVATSIEVLVVPAGDPSGDLEADAALEDLLAPDRVPAHDLPFVGRERCALEKDLIRDVQLADVVEHRRPPDVVRAAPRQAGLEGEGGREGATPEDVLAGRVVPCLRAAGEGDHAFLLALRDLDGGALQPADGALEAIEESADGQANHHEHEAPRHPGHRVLRPAGQSEHGGGRAEQQGHAHGRRQRGSRPEQVGAEEDREVAEVVQRVRRTAGCPDDPECEQGNADDGRPPGDRRHRPRQGGRRELPTTGGRPGGDAPGPGAWLRRASRRFVVPATPGRCRASPGRCLASPGHCLASDRVAGGSPGRTTHRAPGSTMPARRAGSR